MAQLMPLALTVSCFSKIQIGFIFLVPAHPGSPGQELLKGFVVVVVVVTAFSLFAFCLLWYTCVYCETSYRPMKETRRSKKQPWLKLVSFILWLMSLSFLLFINFEVFTRNSIDTLIIFLHLAV